MQENNLARHLRDFEKHRAQLRRRWGTEAKPQRTVQGQAPHGPWKNRELCPPGEAAFGCLSFKEQNGQCWTEKRRQAWIKGQRRDRSPWTVSKKQGAPFLLLKGKAPEPESEGTGAPSPHTFAAPETQATASWATLRGDCAQTTLKFLRIISLSNQNETLSTGPLSLGAL